MPSAITAPIYDGTDMDWKSMIRRTVPQFFHHGDVPSLADLRTYSSLDFYETQLEEYKSALAKLAETSDRQLLVEDEKHRKQRRQEYEEAKERKALYLERYNKVKGEIEAWEAGDLEPVKESALKLINESIEWDCKLSEEWYLQPKRSAAEIRAQKQEHFEWLIESYSKDVARAQKQVEDTMKWVKALEAL